MNGDYRSRTPVYGLLLACTLLGCGSQQATPTAAVSGTVTLDGKDLSSGVIRFVPIDGTPGKKTSISIDNGRFDTAAEWGPPTGNHRIEIESRDTGGFAMDDEEAIELLRKKGKRPTNVIRVPAWYSQSSNLRENVLADRTNQFVFELHSRRRR